MVDRSVVWSVAGDELVAVVEASQKFEKVKNLEYSNGLDRSKLEPE